MDNKQLNKGYPFTVWLLTISIGPVFLQLVKLWFSRGNIVNWYTEVFLFIVVGGVLSLPALFLFILLYRYVSKKNQNMLLIRFMLFTFTLCTIILTSVLIAGGFNFEFITIYALANIAGLLMVKLKVKI